MGMNTVMSVDRDIEFEVDWDFESPDFRRLVARPERMPEEMQSSTYYDTPDLRLWARGLTLQHRETAGSEQGEWTLRMPTETGAPSALSWAGKNGLVPEEAYRILRGTVRRSELTSVAEYDTTRRRLVMAAGTEEEPWGEVDDDLTTVRGGSNAGIRFRRISVHLWPGYPDVAESVLEHLQGCGAEVTEQSRLSFGLGDLSHRARPRSRGPRRHITLGDTIKASVGVALDRLLDRDYRVRIDFKSAQPHDVHQMRVAVRRLRSDLRTFGRTLDPVWLGHTVSDLRWLGEALGRVRDCDVVTARLRADLEQLHVEAGPAKALLRRLSDQRREETEQLEAALNDDRYIDLLDRLHAMLSGPLPVLGDTDVLSADVLPGLVRKRWRALRRKVREGGDRPGDRELHRMRIAAKRLRYAAEASVLVVGKPAKRTAKAAEKVQTVLGEFHDSVAAVGWIQDQSDDEPFTTGEAVTAGMLIRDERLQQARLRDSWVSEWKDLKRKKNLAWLSG
jgi:CHAD domain-containing protein